MNAEELAGRVAVRHREAGHLRLELPPELCHAQTAGLVDASLREVEGVYRVDFDLASRRLSIRFDAHVCSVGQVARQLKELIAAVAPHLPAVQAAAPDAAAEGEATAGTQPQDVGLRVREAVRALAVRVNAALDVLRNPGVTPPEGSLQAKLQPVIASALTEKAIINFLNDLVAFYLIKAHWELISQRWLKDPLKYRNAWLTVFYLVFLLVRYRKQAAKK
ncbi:MAG: hypothetical protein OEL88_01795 [Sterolibacteriaceae bacterium MAG5]|nr:hypothetical protein [Candidatus Nitricoxidireducens bremensis]